MQIKNFITESKLTVKSISKATYDYGVFRISIIDSREAIKTFLPDRPISDAFFKKLIIEMQKKKFKLKIIEAFQQLIIQMDSE